MPKEAAKTVVKQDTKDLYKIVVCGPHDSGKSTLAKLFASKTFDETMAESEGSETHHIKHTVDGKTYDLEILVLHPDFVSEFTVAFKDVDSVFICFDSTADVNVDDIESYRDIAVNCCDDCLNNMYLVACKMDKGVEKSEIVNQMQCKFNVFINWETSAKDNIGVSELFDEAVRVAVKNHTSKVAQFQERDSIIGGTKEQEKGCCIVM